MRAADNAVAAVILAAGASARLGRPKQLLTLDGQTLLRRTVEAATKAGCAPVLVVLGAHAEQFSGEIVALAGSIQVIVNEKWSKGMGTSLASGVAALEGAAPNVRAAVVLLCDQPHVSAEVVRALVEAFFVSGKPVVASEYGGVRGAPCLFARSLFPELAALSGDMGARKIIARQAVEHVAVVPFAGGQEDVDTPDDWRRVAGKGAAGEP